MDSGGIHCSLFAETVWGSPAFRGGTRISLNLNIDFPVSKATNIETSFGYTGAQTIVNVVTGEEFASDLNHRIPVIHREGVNSCQFSYQWAVEQQLTDTFQIFVHGQFLGSVPGSSSSNVVGACLFEQISRRIMIFASFNAGLGKLALPFSTQSGTAFAF